MVKCRYRHILYYDKGKEVDANHLTKVSSVFCTRRIMVKCRYRHILCYDKGKEVGANHLTKVRLRRSSTWPSRRLLRTPQAAAIRPMYLTTEHGEKLSKHREEIITTLLS